MAHAPSWSAPSWSGQLPPAMARVCAIADPMDDAGDGFRWTVLRRDGLRPLAIRGRVLLRGDNRCAGLPWWSAVTVYEAPPGLALAVTHAPQQDSSETWHDASLCADPAELRAHLAGHDPLRALPPAPPQATAFLSAWAGLLRALFGPIP